MACIESVEKNLEKNKSKLHFLLFIFNNQHNYKVSTRFIFKLINNKHDNI